MCASPAITRIYPYSRLPRCISNVHHLLHQRLVFGIQPSPLHSPSMPYFVVFSSRNEWVCCNLPAVTFFEHVECLKPQSRRFARRSTDRTHSWRRHEACRKGGNIETLWVKISGNRKISGHGHQVLSNIAEVIWIPLMECDGESWRLGGRLGRKMIYIRPAGLAMEGKASKQASKP